MHCVSWMRRRIPFDVSLDLSWVTRLGPSAQASQASEKHLRRYDTATMRFSVSTARGQGKRRCG